VQIRFDSIEVFYLHELAIVAPSLAGRSLQSQRFSLPPTHQYKLAFLALLLIFSANILFHVCSPASFC
ncbi:hypothetical protein A2U01_0080890, partial [Trifolium medium]|nr:hypothetical protein [Trifolium medium]